MGPELDRSDVAKVHPDFDGPSYVIDLSTANASAVPCRAVPNTLAQYTDVACRDEVFAREKTPRASADAQRTDLEQIHDWADKNNYTVSSRGRVPNAIPEAYDGR